MNIISLAHHRSLKYRSCSDRIAMVMPWLPDPENTTVITFAKTGQVAREICAFDRLCHQFAGDVVISYFEYTPLFALLVWDIAHTLPVGSTLFLHVSDNVAELLTRSYYENAFDENETIAGSECRAFVKTKELPIEVDHGLEKWSFCIPVGNGSSVSLNACVGRIIELDIPEYEIILCGRPANDFRYWEQVRIVGEDVTSPPVHITRKKNILARSALNPNLCILHDRVLLPRNFYSAVQRMGDDYPMTGFQSFWFAGKAQTLPLRYSDFCVADSVPSWVCSKARLTRQEIPLLASQVLHAQHPARSDFGRDYLTGSLYLCKRALWNHLPQNEELFWQEYEDVEQGLFAAKAGIPSRINPYSFTQTLSCRTVMHNFGWLTGRNRAGSVMSERPWGICLLPRRPHLSVTEKQAVEQLRLFARRYSVPPEMVEGLSGRISGLRRYILISRMLWAVKGDTTDLLRDWYQLILCESPVPVEKEALGALLNGAGTPADKKMGWLRHPTLLRQVFNNLFSSPFTSGAAEPHSRIGLWLGCLSSTIWFFWGSKHTEFRLPFWSVWREILNGTARSSGGARDAE